MGRTVFVNGEFVDESAACISIFDRGFLFADGIYEVSSVLQGKLIDNDNHLARLHRSMNELSMTPPASDTEITAIQEKLIALNNLKEGLVYLQVTRGAEDREFAWGGDLKPSLVMFTQEKPLVDSAKAKNGIRVITAPDIRWQRCDIKTTSLLAACMAKVQARDAGVDDAWFFDEAQCITEGSSNNAYIVTQDDTIITRPVSNAILHGITRKAILALAAEAELSIEERLFTVEEAKNAKEAFITSASTFVWPVIEIDKQPIAEGKPGPIATRLREIYIETALA